MHLIRRPGVQRAAVVALAIAALSVSACGGRKADPAAPDGRASEAAQPEIVTLEDAANGDWRMPAEKARDPYRHPVETLKFFGLKGNETVAELYPGGGWYTAIIGPFLKSGGGRLIAVLPDPGASEQGRKMVETYRGAFVDHPETYGQIEIANATKSSAPFAPDNSVDVVLTFRNVHTWMMGGYAEKVFADSFRALKPGGVMGVEEHRLPSSRDQDLAGSTGYVQEAYVIQLAEAAGFVFEEASEINANPKDTADHPLGVWMLPPSLAAPPAGSPAARDYDRAKYQAIGESDRMTLRFRKPVSAASPAPAQN
jgi:predicted methyltransferase